MEKLSVLHFSALVLLAVGLSQPSIAQQKESSPGLRAAGLTFGIYDPSFDYFDRTPWDFSHGPTLGLELETNLTRFLGIKSEVSLFRTESQTTRFEGAQNEMLRYHFLPFSLSPVYYQNLDFATLVAGAGVDLVYISGTYESDSHSQGFSGGTTTLHLLIGFERRIGSYLAGLNMRYVFGKFDQQIRFSETENPGTFEISLDGIAVGISLKYAFGN